MMKYFYEVHEATTSPELGGALDASPWNLAPTIELENFWEPVGVKTFRPKTMVKVLHYSEAIYVSFVVEDQYVRCVHTTDQENIFEDSCVEMFIAPKNAEGYFNIETNCGGSILMWYITDPTGVMEGKIKKADVVSKDAMQQIIRYHSLPKKLEEEITEPVTWRVDYKVPLKLLEEYTGQKHSLKGEIWKANFYKCAEKSSHPHWGMWSPIQTTYLNFHQPQYFGEIKFL